MFWFCEQKLRLADGTPSTFLGCIGQCHYSIGLEEFCVYAANRMSYDVVALLIKRFSGQPTVCAQTICNWVEARARQLDASVAEEVASASSLPMPSLAEHVDLYDKDAREVLLMVDAIGVKAQKPTRQREGQSRQPKPHKRHDIDVMLAQGRDGSMRYLVGSSDKKLSLVDVAGAHMRREWQEQTSAVPVVAISDGAAKIRSDLVALFGRCVPVILDWYHLEKRVYEHLSMAVHGSAEREALEQRVLGSLWHGDTDAALEILDAVKPRNASALTKLVTYLDKHRAEIIDYATRKSCGKRIGSGRIEKAVDQVVGMRQKKKAMSWSRSGSHALAVLKVAELNGEWQALWQMDLAA